MTGTPVELAARIAGEMSIPPDVPMTDEQAAEFRERFGEAMRKGSSHIIPPRTLLTPETARELLRECVTVVKPGEVLVIRTPDDWTAQQVELCQEFIDEGLRYRQLDVAVLFLPGEEFAVAAKGPAAGVSGDADGNAA